MSAVPPKSPHECTNGTDQTVVPVPVVSEVLKSALLTLDKRSLLGELMAIAQTNAAAQRLLEDRLLVRRRDVACADSDSDGSESEDTASKKRKRSSPRDDELVSRFEVCSNCEKQFDVTKNNQGDCIWHEGSWSRLHLLIRP